MQWLFLRLEELGKFDQYIKENGLESTTLYDLVMGDHPIEIKETAMYCVIYPTLKKQVELMISK